MPTVTELAQELGWSTERVGECRSMFVAFSRPHSLDQPQGPADAPRDPRAPDTRPPSTDDNDAREHVRRLLSSLSPFEKEAIEFRFGLHGGEPQNVHAIARSLDHSPADVRTALRIAMAKLLRDSRRQLAAHGTDRPDSRGVDRD